MTREWFVSVTSTDDQGFIAHHGFFVEAEDVDSAEAEAVRQIREDIPSSVSVAVRCVGGQPAVYPRGKYP